MKLKKLLISTLSIMMFLTSSPLYILAENTEEINEPNDPSGNVGETPIPEKELTIYQELIDNLPDAKWVNKTNLDELLIDLAEIEQALLTLTEEETKKLNLTKYVNLLEKVDELNNEKPPLMMLLGETPDPSISSTIVDEDIIVSIVAGIGVNEYTVTLPKEVNVIENESSFSYTVEGNWTIADQYVAVDIPEKVTLSNGTNTLDVTVDNSRYGFWSNGTGIVTLNHGEFPCPGTWECDLITNISLNSNIVLGISRRLSDPSPGWVRNNITKGVSVKAAVNGSNYYSEFDTAPIYRDIKRVVIDNTGNELEYTADNLSLGDVMVRIPKFYYQRYQQDGKEYINISPVPQTGFETHPAFVKNDYDGISQELSCIYVAAYKTGENHVSKSNVTPLVGVKPLVFRMGAINKIASSDDGWSVIDLSTYSAIQMLILVEYANNDVQTIIGPGYTNGSNSEALITGTCDVLYSLGQLSGYPDATGTTADKKDVIWRGIEGFWGNVNEFTEGLSCYDSKTLYICNDIFKFGEDPESKHTELSYKFSGRWLREQIQEEGLDTTNPWVMLPAQVLSSQQLTASTFYTDEIETNTGFCVLYHGGDYDDQSKAGLFYVNTCYTNKSAFSNLGSRLLYIPIS